MTLFYVDMYLFSVPWPNPLVTRKKKAMPRVSRRKFVLEAFDTNIHAQAILDAIFESDDEEDVQVSKRHDSKICTPA